MGETMEMGEGERLHRQKRRQFWWTLAAIGLSAMPIGIAVGYYAGHEGGDLTAFWRDLPPALAVAIVGTALLAFAYGCWRFMRAIDEVETIDNLWGSTASYYVYATLFPAWWALAQAQVVPQPNDWAIWLAALIGGLAAYGWRKWRAR